MYWRPSRISPPPTPSPVRWKERPRMAEGYRNNMMRCGGSRSYGLLSNPPEPPPRDSPVNALGVTEHNGSPLRSIAT